MNPGTENYGINMFYNINQWCECRIMVSVNFFI